MSPVSPTLDDTARRARAKRRLYIVAQAAGWGGMFAMQLFFLRMFPDHERKVSDNLMFGAIAVVSFLGFVLTHGARGFMTRWGWRELDWRALLPRALAMALGLSLLWTAVGSAFNYGVLGLPWSERYAPWLILSISVINGWFTLLGWLSFYFIYHLFDRFNRSEIERLQLQSSVKEAELRALKAQINPHFIFNALNSVRALIDEDPARARRTVTQLANLLRYSLQCGQLEKVPFEDELAVVNDYLTLEQVRHEERLRLRLAIAPETLRVPIPPMVLQTLVENAVKYGISQRTEGGEIAITAALVGDALELRVSNPGRLVRIAAAHHEAGSTGLGLRNASERLRLLFGDQATLRLHEPEPGLVAADVTVPLDDLTRQMLASLPRMAVPASAERPSDPTASAPARSGRFSIRPVA